MSPFFRDFKIETASFWVGFAASTLFWWLFLRLRAWLPGWRDAIQKSIRAARESLTASTETRLRADTVRLTQRMHLASLLFPLDEVLIEPRLILPPAPTERAETLGGNIITETLPYLPDWPEFSAAFNAPTMSLVEALEGGANLILMGAPGSGKTVALAGLAAAVARGDEGVGKLADLVPYLVHAADIPPSFLENRAVEETLIEAVATRASTLTLTRLPNLVKNTLETGRALLLLDGLDELPPASIKQISSFVAALLQKYPGVRAVVASGFEYYDGLAAAGLVPVALAAWSSPQYTSFVEKWQQAWEKWVLPEGQRPADEPDPTILNGWLEVQEMPLSPSEFTLKAWAVYAGDVIGPDPVRLIEAHIRRLSVNIPNGRQALEALARQMITNLNPLCLQREAENWVFEYEQAAPPPLPEADAPSKETSGQKKAAPRPTSQRIIPALVSSGFLTPRPESRLNFSHPVLLGYLAGSAFARSGSAVTLDNQPDWSGKTLSLAFQACFGDASPVVKTLLEKAGDPLLRGPLTAGRWLRLAPKSAPWRPAVLRHLANALQKEQFTLSIGARLITAMALSGETNLGTFFRQFLQSEMENIRYLAILGCGLVRDPKAVNELGLLVENASPRVGQAACLALTAIGDKPAHDAVLTTLLQGSETVRNTAAAILALDPKEGHAVLEEASRMDDLLVRRAAVYGIAHVKNAWATQLLEKIAVEDGQWVVRNAAAQGLDEIKRPSPYVPRPHPALHEIPWLIAYAAQKGMGVSPGEPALELLLQAVQDGQSNERMQALDYLRLHNNENMIVALYNVFYSSDGEVREAAFNVLWHMAVAGIQLPPPTQFGLG